MSRSVVLLPEAESDLDRLVEFLVSENLGAAERAADAIIEAIRSLADHAERGRMMDDFNGRELFVRWGRAGYVLQYRVEPKTVIVARIFHGREAR